MFWPPSCFLIAGTFWNRTTEISRLKRGRLQFQSSHNSVVTRVFRVCVTTRETLWVVALAIIGICRTYGAWHLPRSCTQCFPFTSFRASALGYRLPRLRRCVATHKSETTSHEMLIASCDLPQEDSKSTATMPKRQNQSANAGPKKSERRRRDTT
jgi:hypothetical protein